MTSTATASSPSRSCRTAPTTPTGTLVQAREYWARLDRPNTMIKIPGTPEGVPAIEQAIFEGINVNVTLLFGVERYAAVAEAYIRGLERRLEQGLSVDVHSVASFFVSRVDTEVDKRLEALGRGDLAGTAALANARAAYARFEEIFLGERFAALRAAGALVQRPLWASTGTKNPAYSETKYVDGLVAADTVNTMPMKTLLAVGRARRDRARQRAARPAGRARRARRGRHRHGRRHRDAAARRHRRLRRADEQAAGGHRERARGGGDRTAPGDRRDAGRRALGRGGGARRRRRQGGRRAARLGEGRVALGRTGRAGDRRSPRMADDLRRDARARR